jgi:hypothetical protein
MKTCIVILMSLLAGSLLAEPNSCPDLSQVLGQLEKQHGSIKSLAAQFRQEKVFSFMDKPVVSRGFIVFEVPNKIRFDITEPFQTAMLDDGKNIQRFEFVDGQWKPLQFGGGKSIKLVMEQIGQWMQGKFAGQEEIFTLSVSGEDPNDYAALNLQPRHKQFRQYIEKIQIHIAKAPSYSVSRIIIYEPQGDSFSLLFSNEQRNMDLPKDCFSRPETADQCLGLFNAGQPPTPGN